MRAQPIALWVPPVDGVGELAVVGGRAELPHRRAVLVAARGYRGGIQGEPALGVETAGDLAEPFARGSGEQGEDLNVDASCGEVRQCRARGEGGVVEVG